MQFTKNTSKGGHGGPLKVLIKVILVIFLLFLSVVIIDRIELPVPENKIEKIISNENFKTLK